MDQILKIIWQAEIWHATYAHKKNMIQGVCDIYPHKICSWDICPGKRIWTKIYYWLIFLLNQFFLSKCLGGWIFSGANIYCNKSFLELMLLDQHFFNPKLFWPTFFWKILLTTSLWPKFFLDRHFFEQFLGDHCFLGQTF